MADRIYVTYAPTTVPGSYHTAIHYQRTDPAGNVVQHFVIEAIPEKLKELSALDKATGVIEETFRNDNGPSRFGRIDAKFDNKRKADDDPNTPYENIAEGEDLSEKWARMQLFAYGVNRAGFAYRGDHQNSNTFAAAALRAGELPPATGVARDPAGTPGELLEFFTPGLNEPLKAPIGPNSRYEPALSPNELRKFARSAAPDVRASTSSQKEPQATPALQPDISGERPVRDLSRVGQHIGNRLMAPAEAALPPWPLSPGPTGSNFRSEDTAFGDRSENATSMPKRDTYPRLRSVSSAFPSTSPSPAPELAPPLGIFSGKPMSLLPPSVFGLPDKSDAVGNGDIFSFLAGLASWKPTPTVLPQSADSRPPPYLDGRIAGQSKASIFDTGAPAVPFSPSDDPNLSGGLLGRFFALMDTDAQIPMQPTQPPADQPRGFYDEDPLQPWALQRRR